MQNLQEGIPFNRQEVKPVATAAPLAVGGRARDPLQSSNDNEEENSCNCKRLAFWQRWLGQLSVSRPAHSRTCCQTFPRARFPFRSIRSRRDWARRCTGPTRPVI